MKTKRITPLAFHLSTFTPDTRFRGARDRFKPLFLIALAVLAADILYLLHLEAMYREDARRASMGSVEVSPSSPSLREDAPGRVFSTEPGARITGQRNGQPQLNW